MNKDELVNSVMSLFVMFLFGLALGSAFSSKSVEEKYNTPAKAKIHYEELLKQEKERHKKAIEGETNN